MTSPTAERTARAVGHLAHLYDGLDDFVETVGTFVAGGLERDDDVLLLSERPRLDAIRDLHGTADGTITYVDAREAGQNPAVFVSVWSAYLERARSAGRAVTGVGEPLWRGRSTAEAAEVMLNERIVNSMHFDFAGVSLLCSYDLDLLEPELLADVVSNHELVRSRGTLQPSHSYAPVRPDQVLSAPLPPPPAHAVRHVFGADSHAWVREVVERTCTGAGLGPDRSEDVVLAVHELATNCVRHGGGTGVLRVWDEGSSLVFELSSAGRFVDPMVGRRRPGPTGESGRGVWLANQLCDLVQLRNTETGTVARAHVRLRP